MFAATALYDTEHKEWFVEMYGRRLFGAADEQTARATALILSELRS
ncbi:hypothetical protein [Mesorhizobium silamurunense]|nr:hypothetical protein [Mesorhizobium silamurunense]